MCAPMWEQLFLHWLGSNPSVLLLRICRIVASAMKSTSWPGTRPSPSCACPSATAMARSSESLRPSTSPPAVSSSPKTTKRCVVYSPSVVPGWTFGILFPWERGSARVYLQFGFIFPHLSCGLVGRSQTFVSVFGLLPAKFSDSSHLSPETSCSEFRRAWRILFLGFVITLVLSWCGVFGCLIILSVIFSPTHKLLDLKEGISTSPMLHCGSTLSKTKATLLFNALLEVILSVANKAVLKRKLTMKHLYSVLICYVVFMPHKHMHGKGLMEILSI